MEKEMAKLIKTKVEWEGTINEELSVIEGPSPPAFPSNSKLKTIGRGQPRIDGPERVTGRAVYTYDVHLPGMLYARVLRSPYPHARITHLDTSRASALPGVRAVVSYLNAPPVDWYNGTRILEPILRYAGDEVAAAAADDEYIAQDALKLIDVEYEPLPFSATAEESLKPGAPKIHPGGNLMQGKPRSFRHGDIKKGFAEADVILEETFQTQAALHNCLESHGAVASWNGDELTVWESTQSIYRVQDDLVEAFNLPRNKVRVICQYMGSGFGSKQFSGKWSILAALLARQAGRPVQLMYDRHEENIAAGNRIPTIQHLKIGAKKDGTLTAMELTVTAATGAYGGNSPMVEGPVQVMYDCPNISTVVSSVFTNTGPARSFRGPGYVEGSFPLESLMDDLADRLKIDPVQLRLKNYASKDQRTNRPFSAKHLDECYRQGAELIGWKSRAGSRDGSKRRCLGMASQTWGGGGGPPAYAWVRINSDGSVEVVTGSQDIGTGTRTVMAQIAAQEFGIKPEEVKVYLGDTSVGPYDPVSWGSMTVSSVGPAVRQAAIDALHQLREICAGFLNLPVEQIEIHDGGVYLKGESQALKSINEVAGEIGELTILGKGAREPNNEEFELRTFGAQFADVEVDTLTGEVKVQRLVTVHDFGRVINPLGAGGIAEGAVIQGIGYALTEGRVVDQKSGIVLNANMEGYELPTALDFNEIGYAFIDQPDNRANNLGAKGLGEPALIPTAPAIANAIKMATGLRFTELPITRDKILEAIRRQGPGSKADK
jgi:CO/xanthine dehydrogenase Mo-binding subunit